MLQKAFGFCGAETARAFLPSTQGGKKKEKKEKMNERGGTVFSAPALYLLSAQGRAASHCTPMGTRIQDDPVLSLCSTHGQSVPIPVPS